MGSVGSWVELLPLKSPALRCWLARGRTFSYRKSHQSLPPRYCDGLTPGPPEDGEEVIGVDAFEMEQRLEAGVNYSVKAMNMGDRSNEHDATIDHISASSLRRLHLEGILLLLALPVLIDPDPGQVLRGLHLHGLGRR